jgi:hypothetical protein
VELLAGGIPDCQSFHGFGHGDFNDGFKDLDGFFRKDLGSFDLLKDLDFELTFWTVWFF